MLGVDHVVVPEQIVQKSMLDNPFDSDDSSDSDVGIKLTALVQKKQGNALDSDGSSDSDIGIKSSAPARKKQGNKSRVLSDDSDSDIGIKSSKPVQKKQLNKSRVRSDDSDSEIGVPDDTPAKNDARSESDSDSDIGRPDDTSVARNKTKPKDDSSDSDIGRPDDMNVAENKNKRKSKSRPKSDDSSDSDIGRPDDMNVEENKSKRKSNSKPKRDDSSDSDIGHPDDMNVSENKSKRKSKSRPRSDDSSDSSIGRPEDMYEEDKKSKKKSKSRLKRNDSSDSDSIGRPDDMFVVKNKKKSRSRSDDSDSYSDSPKNDSGSDGEDRNSPRPEASERKSSNRRAKSERKPRKPKKSERAEVHSESQRIVRESSLRLPYHKPEKKSLDDFFNKKPSITFLKPVPLRGSRRLNVGLALHSKHSISNINKPSKLQLITKTSKAKTESDSLQLPSSPMEDFPIVENWLKNIQEPSKNTGDLANPSSADPDLVDPKLDQVETDKNVSNNDKLGISEENLPNSEDVEDSLHLTGILSQTQDELQEFDTKDTNVDSAVKIDSDQVKTDINVDVATSGVDDNPAEKSADSVAQDIKEHEHSSADKITNEQENAEQTSDSQNDSQNLTALKEDNVKTPVVGTDQSQTPQDNQMASTPSAPQPTDSSSKLTSAAKRRQLILQASLEKFKSFTPTLGGSFTPKLGGSPEAVIDLDGSGDDESEAGPAFDPGLMKLMNKFAEHSKQSHIRKKKKRQVEVSVVSKEVDKDGKEDLKLDKIVMTLDGEEAVDPSLAAPGAKLLKLKDNLQEKMRLIRAEARQKRQELYRLDNEDLFGEGEEDEDGKKKEEAELTDQTDTDYDPDEDNIKDDEISDDDEDVEEMDEEEEPVRKKFAFGDEEADVDDDDDDDDDEEEDDEEFDEELEEEGDETKKATAKKDEENEKAEMASGEESSDEEEDMGRRKITPTRARRKKKLVLDEDEEDEEHMVLKIPEDEEPEVEESKTKLKDPLKATSETSRQSVAGSTASSEKTSTVTKTSTGSVGFNLNGSKTMDMFDSNTNLTSNGGDTDNKASDDVSPTQESTGFMWSAIKAHKEAENNKDDVVLGSTPLKLDSASNSLDTSFEIFGSVIPGHQPGGGMRHYGKPNGDDAKDTFTPFSRHKSLMDSEPKSSLPSSSKMLSQLTMPVEDSQDLFRDESPLPNLAVTDSQQESQSFHFSFGEDETQSQFLDENGFLNVRPSIPKPKPTAKKLFPSNGSQGNMDELLGLCSGQFSGGTQAPRSSSPRTFGGTGPFSQITKGLQETQGGMDELLGLCSGTFAKTQAQEKDIKETTSTNKSNKDDDQESESSFHLVSDNEAFKSDQEDEEKNKFKGLSSDEDEKKAKEDEGGEDAGEKSRKRRRIKMMGSSDEEDGKEELRPKVKKLKGLSKKQQKIIQRNFLEAEAELSGSEFDSDENYDAEEYGDELEVDNEADNEDLGDEEALRSQLNKVHMKALDDEDARKLRIYKELLLKDGDLHSDNKGRQRQFKWRNQNDESSIQDLFSNNSDGEVEENQDDEDTQWRMKRFEREQWLKENKKTTGQEEKDDHDDDDIIPAEEENSQFMKFMKTAVQRNKKVKAPAATPEADSTSKPATKETNKRVSTPKVIKTRGKFHGSFLHRTQDVAKIAANKMADPNGVRMSRGFVFQAMSPTGQNSDKKPKVKRSTSVAGSMPAPKAKRPRLDRSQSTASQNSVFSHL